jgi:hypothetical protein
MRPTESSITSPSDHNPSSYTAIRALLPVLACLSPSDTTRNGYRRAREPLDPQDLGWRAALEISRSLQEYFGRLKIRTTDQRPEPKCRMRSSFIQRRVQCPNIPLVITLKEHPRPGQELSYLEAEITTPSPKQCRYRRHNSCRGFRIAADSSCKSSFGRRPISALVSSLKHLTLAIPAKRWLPAHPLSTLPHRLPTKDHKFRRAPSPPDLSTMHPRCFTLSLQAKLVIKVWSTTTQKSSGNPPIRPTPPSWLL